MKITVDFVLNSEDRFNNGFFNFPDLMEYEQRDKLIKRRISDTFGLDMEDIEIMHVRRIYSRNKGDNYFVSWQKKDSDEEKVPCKVIFDSTGIKTIGIDLNKHKIILGSMPTWIEDLPDQKEIREKEQTILKTFQEKVGCKKTVKKVTLLNFF